MFVMLSHLSCGSKSLDMFYEPFFLTTFFFLSGYVYNTPGSFKEHIARKFRGLFVPWLVFSNLNICLSMLITLKENRNYAAEFFWNLMQIRGHGDGVWFVAALFVAFIPFYFTIKWNKPIKACLITFALSVISLLYSTLAPKNLFPWNGAALPWHLEYIFQAMLWMVLGYYFKIYVEHLFDELNTTANRMAVWVIYLLVAYLPETASLTMLLSYIRSAFGIVAVIATCKTIKSNRYVQFVGANTLTYFALHGKVYAVLENVLEKLLESFYMSCLANPFASSALAVGITIVMSLVLIIPAMIINKHFPWILGRKRKG